MKFDFELMKTSKINILVANNHLNNIGGSETFTYTLIEELVKRDNINVEYFTFEKGLVSVKIEKELKVNFLSKKKYDLILASHNTCVDRLYKLGFIIQICHGIYPTLEQPSYKANGYVSVSQEVQNYLCRKGFLSKIILNGINLDRFKPRKDISKNLQTVLSLCQSEKANDLIEKCCDYLKIKLIKANKNCRGVWNVEELINSSDLVIGLGRSSFDAMACGRPVIIYDHRDYMVACGDGYINNVLGFSLLNNCSGRYFKYDFSIEDLIGELQKYNYEDGEFYRKFAENELDIIKKADEILMFWDDLKKAKRNYRYYKMKRIIGKQNTDRVLKMYIFCLSLFR